MQPHRRLTNLTILTAIIGIMFLASSCSSLPQNVNDPRVTVYGGEQAADDAPGERATTFGISYEYEGQGDTPLGSEIGFLYGTASGDAWLPGTAAFEAEIDTYEMYAGLRKDWRFGRISPFLGGGINLMLADVSAFGDSDQDFNIGGYAHAGARLAITDVLSIGAEARYRAMPDFEVGDNPSVSGDLSGLGVLFSLSVGF